MKHLVLLALISVGAFAGNSDIPVRKIDNTSGQSGSSVRAGFIINDDHPQYEFKLETTYGSNSGIISVRHSNGDNNEEVISVDMASQQELDSYKYQVSAGIKGASDLAVFALDHADRAYGVAVDNSELIDLRTQQADQRMTAAEQELYSTTALSQGNKRAISQLDSRVTSLELDVEELREDMYRGVASAMAIGNLPTAPQGKWGFVAGVGRYGHKEAVAMGLSASGESLSIKTGVSYDNEEIGLSGSFGVWW